MKSIALSIKQAIFALFKKCRIPVAILIVVFAIVFTLFRALTPWVKQYKVQVEQHLSVLLGQPVSIGDLETSWYWFEPVLKMDKVILSDDNHHELTFNKLLIGINLWSSLWHWQIKPGVLYIDDVNLNIRQVDGHWELDGLKSNEQAMTIDHDSYLMMIGWLLSQDSIIVKHMSADVYFADGTSTFLREIDLKSVHSYGHYRLSGHVQLAQDIPTELSIVADLKINLSSLSDIGGHVYVSMQKFLPLQWKRFFPEMPYDLKQGECNLETWFDLEHGHLSGLQSIVNLKDLEWVDENHSKTRHVELLKANVALKKTLMDWRLSADHVILQMGGILWPENSLQLDYKEKEHAYHGFVKTLLLHSLEDMDIPWPQSLKPFLIMEPEGELHDTQVNIKQCQLDYILTRFEHFGWHGNKNYPSVSNISGVLSWDPNQGRLVLDGENTTIKPDALPPLVFSLFNADVDWKELNNGFRISMDRFVLSHENLVLSATGALDNPNTPDANLRMTVEFAAKDAKNLLNYIPSVYVKPKLDFWLKHDIKHIGHVSGRMVVDGKLVDFPYDDKPGEFSIISHVNGVDLLINKDWPINRDIDADLIVNNRSLVANIDQATLAGVLVDKVNLAINGIGLGKESLLIHGEVEAPGDQVKKYIFSSPLSNRLSRWKALDIDDSLFLDLRLDIPLYPESDHVAALGTMKFDNNPVTVNLPVARLKLEDMTGSLQFNEYGLTDGGLQGTLAGLPISMHAQSIIEPKICTVLSLESEMTTDYLQKTISTPLLTWMSGHLNITGLWTIYPNPNDPDQLHIATTLKGVAINLPNPLGKRADDLAPLTMDVVFNPKSTVGVHLEYDNHLQSLQKPDPMLAKCQAQLKKSTAALSKHEIIKSVQSHFKSCLNLFIKPNNNRISSDLLLAPDDGHLLLSKGDLHFGEGHAAQPNQTGLSVTGFIDEFNQPDWHAALSKLPANSSSSAVIETIQSVDLSIDKLKLLTQQFDKLSLKIRKLSQNDWYVLINQADLAADLHYQPSKNIISGQIKRLYLHHVNSITDDHSDSKWKLKPKDIPNLNLKISDLKIDDVAVGAASIKSSSTKTDWLLNDGSIQSPDYQLNLQGSWKNDDKINSSNLQAHLVINDLGKSLERWHITPAVYAHPGDVTFQGGWPGPFFDFSLRTLMGNMNITLKNGRISHFDKETEEKLGLGKLLSILSLQTIPRRLKLDFSDLSEQGYSFDVFKGKFVINNGVMSTKDSYIDGPVAYASMEGDLDLIRHLYDVNLRITPYITASLPVVATIAGGPIAGLATWLASNIINKGMQKISGYTYKVSGPWLDPIVQQVSIYRK